MGQLTRAHVNMLSDSEEDGGTADHSTRVNMLSDSEEEGGTADQSTC